MNKPALGALSLGLTLLAGVGVAATPAAPARAASLTASVTVNATSSLGKVPAHAIGLNTAVYDRNMNDSAIPGLLKSAHITALRYPGGSYSDIYNWRTQQAAAGGYVAPNTSFSDFMGTARSVGAAPVITLNYGTGTPSLAASWARAAATDNVQFWEVGNEVSGNGTYGVNWETDSHCRTSLNGPLVTVGSEPSQTYNCGPNEYAVNFLQFQSAIHSVNAHAKVCAVVTTPGFWPDQATNSEYPHPWNQTVLSILKSHTQCIIVHYYPGGSSAAGMLTDPSDIPGMVSTLHSELSQYAGIANPSSIPIIITETNSTIDPDTQPAALYAADMYMTWLEHGAANVDWWNEHNGPGTPSIVDGAQDYGDGGILSSAGSSDGVTEPPLDTPFAPYYAIEMLSKLQAPGDTMVRSASSRALVKVHAVRDASGNLNILIDNEDVSNSYTVSLTTNGFTASGTPTVYTLANNATSITSASGSAHSVTVGPYSLTVVHIPGKGGGTGPIKAGDDSAKCVDDNGGSTANGTKIQMWDCNGGTSQSWTVAADGTLRVSGKCMDITGANYSNGTGIELWDCDGGANQKWRASNGELVNPASGKCLDDPGSNTANGTQLDLWQCIGGSNQKWTIP
jgi:hypothetical protein